MQLAAPSPPTHVYLYSLCLLSLGVTAPEAGVAVPESGIAPGEGTPSGPSPPSSNEAM